MRYPLISAASTASTNADESTGTAALTGTATAKATTSVVTDVSLILRIKRWCPFLCGCWAPDRRIMHAGSHGSKRRAHHYRRLDLHVPPRPEAQALALSYEELD